MAGFDTALPVHAVLAQLHAIEALCGRPRDAPRWAPRSMDLDVLLYDDLICEEPGLKLPRPDLLKRAYMLGPLAELAPDLMHPTAGRDDRRAVAALRPRRPPARAAAGRAPEHARSRGYQPMLRPPSTASTWPVTYGASVAKNRHGARHVRRRAVRA